MPHLSLQYSENLDAKADLSGLCRALHETMTQCPIFELGAIRIRAFPARHFAIADLHPENAFLDISLRVGKGRSRAELADAGAKLMATASAFLADVLAKPHFALSLEIREIDSELSWRKNAIHPRLGTKPRPEKPTA